MEIRISNSNQIALFIVKGKITWENSRVLDTQINKVIENACTHIVFNLDDVTFLCSGGIGALIYNMKKVQDQGGDIFIVSQSDYIQYLFATIGFNIIFNGKIFHTFEEFSETVLVPKGLSLNILDSQTTVVATEEHRFATKTKNAA